MTPQSKSMDQETPEQRDAQEQFIRQVEDRSLPAPKVLTDQRADSTPEKSPALFVP